MAMLWQFVGLVLSFAFRRTTIAVDGFQVVAASAIPALSELAGFRFASNVQSEALAYIGAAAIAWVALRLICAPYFLWRDQVRIIAKLKIELNRPEQIEITRIAKVRAKKRIELAAALRELQLHVFLGDSDARIRRAHKRIARMAAYCQPDETVSIAIGEYQTIVEYNRTGNLQGYTDVTAVLSQYVKSISLFLHGKISTEELISMLPKYIDQKTTK